MSSSSRRFPFYDFIACTVGSISFVVGKISTEFGHPQPSFFGTFFPRQISYACFKKLEVHSPSIATQLSKVCSTTELIARLTNFPQRALVVPRNEGSYVSRKMVIGSTTESVNAEISNTYASTTAQPNSARACAHIYAAID